MSNPMMKTFDYAFLSFLKHRVNGGMVLMVVAVLAMVIANSPWAEAYHAFWNYPVALQVGGFNLFSHHGASDADGVHQRCLDGGILLFRGTGNQA